MEFRGFGTILPDYGNGSQIIFTTRSLEVAKSAHHIHEMNLLDEEKSWNLLQEKLFKADPCPFQLELVGKTIARNCGGHRLSIEVVSGILLASDLTEAAWEDVSDNIKLALEEGGDKVDEILYLGYEYLPHHLRPCFLYLGIFPEGFQIYVSALVRIWIAEGFVNGSTGYKSLEETGEDYVEDLARRSLVLIHKRKSNAGIKCIRVHNLVRGMCLRQSYIDNLNLNIDRVSCSRPQLEVEGISKSWRRVSNSIHCDDLVRGVYGSNIRALFFYSEYGGIVDFSSWMGNVRLLRILDLVHVRSYQLSGEVYELFHLRYLSLRCGSGILEAISNLENLQTLIIYHENIGGVFDKLPEGIWRMPQLRHLRIFSFKFPNEKGPSSPLQNLQTLSQVVDFVCSREILKMVPNVEKLSLFYTKSLKGVVEDYELERGLQLSWEDMKMVASLPNLEVLKLKKHACIGERWETSDGGFSKLLYLGIEDSNLEKWITKSSHFPNLWRLVLVRCSSLLDVPYEMAGIPTLTVIILDDTNQSLQRSAQQIQQDRHTLGHGPLYIISV